MRKKDSRRKQKMYKMKGCSKKTRKNYLGGTGDADVNLAYTGTKVPMAPNPFLAYTGKGGNKFPPENINALNKALPNTGPKIMHPATPFLNPQGSQHGGCGCGMPLMNGGKRNKKKNGGCGPLCLPGIMVGGQNGHRIGCKCSECRIKGGSSQMGGNPGIPYPDGLVGKPWTPAISGWPGVDGIQGDRNFIAPNTYDTDVQTAMISPGAQPPFLGGKGTRKRRQKGGTFSNFISQDLINLGRQVQFGVGSAYNALAGYAAPVNPMPWKGQLTNNPSLATVKAASYY
jgi:hypothetical protein